MTQIQWLNCWDQLRELVQKKTSWGKNELLEVMDTLERAEVRKAEKEGK